MPQFCSCFLSRILKIKILKVKIFIIFRQKTMINHMTAFIFEAVIIVIGYPVRKTEKIIKLSI